MERYMLKKAFLVLIAMTILVSACTTSVHWASDEWWLGNCDGFPSHEEVSQVLKAQEELIKRLQEERLIDSAGAVQCAATAKIGDTRRAHDIKTTGYVIIYRIASQAEVIAALDEVGARSEGLTTFFGVPLRFLKR